MTYSLIKSPIDGRVIEIDGSSEYVNWYKNQGSRLYYIEDFPIKEMYIGWLSKNNRHQISAGRMKNLLSFDESETIWQEDAWFAPISYWISKDLYSGLKYSYNNNFGIKADIALFSGDGNPTKNSIYYIHNLGNTNKKSNNTPTFNINLSYNFDLIGFENSIFVGFEKGVIGSVWDVAINEGKHNKDILATGIRLYRDFDNKIINNLKIYLQYTEFTSGLRNKNTQKNNPAFNNIKQNGFFTGTDFGLFSNRFKIGLTYEMFKRYDYYAHIYSVGSVVEKKLKESVNCLERYRNSYQHSFIINTKFYINKNIYLNFAANFLKDPLNWVSEVLPKKGSNRYKFTINVAF